MLGTKHRKACKLYKDLGKEIPSPEVIGNAEPKPEVPVVGEELIETQSDPAKPSKVVIVTFIRRNHDNILYQTLTRTTFQSLIKFNTNNISADTLLQDV